MSKEHVAKKKKKRNVDLLVISDVHLGTYGCHAKELCRYLKSIKPKKVILNGDILDIWQFKKSFWPKEHMRVIKILTNWIYKGIEVHYITGNHDELLRKFTDFKMGSFFLENKLILELDGKKAWFFHGDVFDVTMQYSKWLVRLGSIGYDILIYFNAFINYLYQKIGKERISLSKKVKNKVKGAVAFINKFETLIADIAIKNKYHYVVCGHIHQPEIRQIHNSEGTVTYLNSGDWVENLSALEYHQGKWSLYQYKDEDFEDEEEKTDQETDVIEKSSQEIFKEMLEDFNLMRSEI